MTACQYLSNAELRGDLAHTTKASQQRQPQSFRKRDVLRHHRSAMYTMTNRLKNFATSNKV